MKKTLIILSFILAIGVAIMGWRLLNRPECDLAITNVRLAPVRPGVGDQVTITYQVQNLGPQIVPSKSYETFVKVNGKIVSFDSSGPFHPMKPGEFNEYSRSIGYFSYIASNADYLEISVTPNKILLRDPDLSNNIYLNISKAEK